MEEVLSLAIDVGKSMIKCGAEINRVEETIIRICHAWGVEKTDVFSTASLISVTCRDKEHHAATQIRRVYAYTANFYKLDRLNQLSRDLCAKKLSIEEARIRFEEIKNEDQAKFHVTVLLGSILAAASFAIFFGGSWKDSICAGIIAVPIYFMNTFITQRRINRLVYTALNSCIAGFLALFAVHFHLADNSSMIMIGDIMLLIPGLMFVNSFRELLCGDVVSGTTRLLDCIMVAAAIACGFAIPILTFNYLF